MCCCCWSCFDLRNRTIFLYTDESNNNTNPNFSNNRLKADMEVGIDGGKVSNERIAGKLKGYFDLAKEEIAKVVRAEEWGLNDEAISRYMNAQRILVEGASAHAPSFISSRQK
ncbi:hypothetical protein RND81_08G039900 [Saponaria officinalis]|uniref:Uncharacterized protein n=1 Tax=Saponaria officinalis TaxID=3572 RepID=A0AAW1J4G3_SAPOF